MSLYPGEGLIYESVSRSRINVHDSVSKFTIDIWF